MQETELKGSQAPGYIMAGLLEVLRMLFQTFLRLLSAGCWNQIPIDPSTNKPKASNFRNFPGATRPLGIH